jgi:preprotein translocase subunit SecA
VRVSILVATFPAYLNALTGDGVHIVTVNDYPPNVTANGWARSHKAWHDHGRQFIPASRKPRRSICFAISISYATNNELLRLPA